MKKRLIEAALKHLNIDYTENQVDVLERFIDALLRWNKTHNLIGNTDLDWLINYQLVDSLLPLKFMNLRGRVCFDLGSGNGLPGIALAVVGEPDLMYLIEKKSKKAAYLSYVVSELELKNIRVLKGRFEDVDPGISFDYGFSKAVGAPDLIWRIVNHVLKPGGSLVVWSGRDGEEQIQRLEHLDGESIEQVMVKKYYFQDLKKTTSLIMIKKKGEK